MLRQSVYIVVYTKGYALKGCMRISTQDSIDWITNTSQRIL
jgi:hypothetical protein